MRTPRFAPLMILLASVAGAETPEEKGLAIATKADVANAGFVGERAQVELVLINAHGDRIVRRMRFKIREIPEDGDKSLSEFDWPADVKGTKMLTWTHKKGDDDQWLYLPSLKRIKRISAKDRSGSFMGSEFAYEDFGGQEIEKYTYKFLREESLDGRPAWVLERFPVSKSGYSRQVSWIDREYMNPVKIEYFDRKGDLLKVAEFRAYRKQGKYWRMGEIHMVNRQTQKQSTFTWKDRELGVKFADREFESAGLEE